MTLVSTLPQDVNKKSINDLHLKIHEDHKGHCGKGLTHMKQQASNKFKQDISSKKFINRSTCEIE